MAAGYFTKQADQISSRYLNDVNDAAQGGAIVSLPSGITGPAVSATQPGDRICLDDITALALSDTVGTGTLWGGIYTYTQVLSTAIAAPAIGTAAFYRATDIGGTAGINYGVTSDANPSTAIPTFFAGVFISAAVKGNYCWIQTQGVANCLFDSGVTAAANGSWVTAKVSASVASTFDVGAVAGVVTLAAVVGVAIGLPVVSTLSKVGISRFMNRI